MAWFMHLDRCGVGDEKNLMGMDGVLYRRQLLHEFFVDVQTARGIDQEDIAKTLLAASKACWQRATGETAGSES